MIGWKCAFGYCDYDLELVTNKVITDANSVYIIPTSFNLPIDYTNRALGYSTSNYPHKGNINEIGSAAQSAMGNDSLVCTIPFGSIDIKYTEQLLPAFPSIRNLCPNLFQYFKDGNKSKYVYISIPGLNREIIISTGSPASLYILSGGSRIFGAQNIGSVTFQNYGQVLSYVGGDISQEKMSNGDNYRVFMFRNGAGYGCGDFNNYTDLNNYLNALFSSFSPPDADVPDNPYEPGGPSGPGDLPPGTFDDDSDPIPDSSLPTISSANTGFTRIYNPTLSQVQDLASYLWTTPDVIETIWNHIKQFFENPMEAMIGFNLVPVPVPNGGTTNFKLMYIDTGVQMTAAASQFVDRDCGTLKIERYYGSALDQSPYTKISCFLPYIGTVQLNTDEVMGTTLQVKYRVDICSGSCVAKIFVDGSCLYQYSGHCAIPIPFSAADFSSYVSAAVSVAKLAIGAATAGAAGVAAGAIPTAAQQTNQVITQATVSAPGSNLPALIPTRSQITEAPSDQSSTEASFSGISPTSISNTVGEIMTSKPHVEHSGSFSGNTGYLGIRRPYVIIERPNMCMPAQYQHFNGFPAMISMELGTCKGYTRIQQVQLTGMTATNPEQAEILELLKSGVVF